MPHPSTRILECRNISIHKPVNREKWYSRFLAPVVVARLLRDISIKAEGGQIHAICGVAGSGKSTLLKAIAGHFEDDLSGTIAMESQNSNKKLFGEIGVFMSSKQKLPQEMTVGRLLYLKARRKQQNCNTMNMVIQIMKETEILGYKDTKCRELSENAKRRTLLAVAMVEEPRILIFDDLLADLEPLSAYQVMLCLQSYARNRNCIVLISLRNPRSDIYQMVDRMTILFYGQVFYSGLTKSLPEYFSNAGFPCPSNENPAIYYLSLATLDRETEERKGETREKALRLVEYQKENDMEIYAEDLSVQQGFGEAPERNNPVRLCWFYVKCSFLSISAGLSYLLLLLLIIPAVNALICLFCSSLSAGHWYTPYNAASTFQLIWFTNFFFSGIFVRNNYNKFIQLLSLTDRSFSVCNTSFFAFLTIQLILTATSGTIGAVMSYWLIDIANGLLTYWLLISFAALFGILLQMILIFLLPNDNNTIFWHLICTVMSVLSGGIIVSIPTSTMLVKCLSLIYPLNYANIIYSNDIIVHLPIENCRRNEKQVMDTSEQKDFCRWKDSSAFLEEMYGESKTIMTIEDAWIILFVQLLTLFVVLLIIIFVKNKVKG